MLVSPTGRNLVLMSDVGRGIDVTDVDLSFSDFAVSALPDNERITTGTYLPTNLEGGDSWPAPRRPTSGATTLATFNGDNPNGTWSLYVVDGADGDQGRIDGWCLSIASGTPTATSLASSANPSPHGTDVVLTATVTTDGSPVTEGTVTFSDGATVLGTVPVEATGVAALTTADLAVGPHRITARFADDGGTFPRAGPPSASSSTLRPARPQPAGGATRVASACPSPVRPSRTRRASWSGAPASSPSGSRSSSAT